MYFTNKIVCTYNFVFFTDGKEKTGIGTGKVLKEERLSLNAILLFLRLIETYKRTCKTISKKRCKIIFMNTFMYE